MANDNQLSVKIESLLPSYLADEGPNLVAFLKAYYEWLETTNQVNDRLGSMLDYNDIDKTLGEFVTFFQREVLSLFPNQVLADKRLLAKNIKDMYQAKGTEESFKLLFRILFDEEIDFFIPEEVILRASDGRWVQENSIRVSGPFAGNPENFGGRKITGQTSGASATVDRSTGTSESGIIVYELFLTAISGNFVDNEVVSTSTGDLQAQIVSAVGPLTGVTVTTGGSGHSRGDLVDFISASGTGGNGVVSRTIDSRVTVSIVDGGNGYRIGSPVSVSGSGIGASFVVDGISNTSIIDIGGTNYTVGTISSIQTIDEGSGYEEPLTASARDSIVAPENLNITSFTIVDGGSGYTNNATITVSGGGGGINANFQITGISNTETIETTVSDQISSLQDVPINTGPTFVSTGANTTSVIPELAAANAFSTILSSTGTRDVTVGTIASIVTSNNGTGYTSDPTVNVIQENIAVLGLDDGSGGTKGDNAVITANTIGFLGNNAILQANTINGSILSVTLSSAGTQYSRFDALTINNKSRAAANATGIPNISGIIAKEGRYTDTKGFLSSNMRLQDNLYYQDFSYVIRSEQYVQRYKDIVTRLVHPSGSKLFGSVTVESPINVFEDINIITDGQVFIGGTTALSIPSTVIVSSNAVMVLELDNVGGIGGFTPGAEFGIDSIELNIANVGNIFTDSIIFAYSEEPILSFSSNTVTQLSTITLDTELQFEKFGDIELSQA